jgi:hypothetical protein
MDEQVMAGQFSESIIEAFYLAWTPSCRSLCSRRQLFSGRQTTLLFRLIRVRKRR